MLANLIIGSTMSPTLGGRLPSRRPQKGPTLCICLGLRTYSSVGLSQPVYVQFKYTNLKTVSQQRVDNNSNETRLTNFRHFSELLRMNVDTDAEATKTLARSKSQNEKRDTKKGSSSSSSSEAEAQATFPLCPRDELLTRRRRGRSH